APRSNAREARRYRALALPRLLRCGEMIALEGRDVDLAKRQLCVPAIRLERPGDDTKGGGCGTCRSRSDSRPRSPIIGTCEAPMRCARTVASRPLWTARSGCWISRWSCRNLET